MYSLFVVINHTECSCRQVPSRTPSS